MVDFISEVQEELRKDDYNKWLRRYGPYVAGLAVAVMAYTGWSEYRSAQNERTARAASLEYSAAAGFEEAGDLEAALARFEGFAATAPDGYEGLSLMRAAAIESERGNADRAVALLDRAAATFDRPRHAHLAQLKAAYILADEGRFADARLRVRAISGQGDPYEFLARELDGFAALADDDMEAARAQFSYLATIPGVSAGVAERASQTLSLISQSPEAVAAATPSTPDTPDTQAPDPAEDN